MKLTPAKRRAALLTWEVYSTRVVELACLEYLQRGHAGKANAYLLKIMQTTADKEATTIGVAPAKPKKKPFEEWDWYKGQQAKFWRDLADGKRAFSTDDQREELQDCRRQHPEWF